MRAVLEGAITAPRNAVSDRGTRCYAPRSMQPRAAAVQPDSMVRPMSDEAGAGGLISRRGVGGVLVGVVVSADDDAVDDVVGEDFLAVQVPAVVVGGDVLELDGTPVGAEDVDDVQAQGVAGQLVGLGEERWVGGATPRGSRPQVVAGSVFRCAGSRLHRI